MKTKRETGNAMKQKVTGVLFHGAVMRQDFVCFFTSSDNLPSGENQTIAALCRSLFVLIEKREAHGLSVVPPELCIQLDNTTKDNKNRLFFAFCEYLVHIGLFVRELKSPSFSVRSRTVFVASCFTLSKFQSALATTCFSIRSIST